MEYKEKEQNVTVHRGYVIYILSLIRNQRLKFPLGKLQNVIRFINVQKILTIRNSLVRLRKNKDQTIL